MDLVEELYNRFPEFDAVNTPIDKELTYVVFGDFSLYLRDLLLLNEQSSISKDQQSYFTEEPIDWEAVNVDELLKRCYFYVDELYLRNDKSINDIIFSSIYWNLADSPYSAKYAKKYFAEETYKKYNEVVADLKAN